MGNSAKYVDQDADCTLSFKFAAGKLDITQDGTCGMGLNVSGAGSYKRTSADAPKFEEWSSLPTDRLAGRSARAPLL